LDFSARFAAMPGTVVLMSGGDLDCARYHILGAKPWLTFSGSGSDMTVSVQDNTVSFHADPFETLRNIIDAYRLKDPDLPPPVSAGLFGYLAYDLKDVLEKLPRTSIDDLRLPHIFFAAPSIIVVHDKITGLTRRCIPIRTISGKSCLDDDIHAFHRILETKPPAAGRFSGDAGGFQSNFTRLNYMDAIEKIIEYIAAGDIYQVNMSQRFQMDFEGDPYTLFTSLYHKNPAPFFAYINAGDHQIVSTSPERFLLRTGEKIETRPIKGTRPRGQTPAEDEKLGQALIESKKDDAELSMIVDLLRNDMGRVSRAGSVRVAEHKRLEAYQNVYHLVSVVESELDTGHDSIDLLKATFPGGSITGCPKIRTMEIIDELEPTRRHIYTGSIGYVGFHDTMDLSIAIRTATVYQGKIIFSVGGGIVYDSDPQDEYEETLHKGQTLMSVFKGKERRSEHNNFVWLNGTLVPRDQAVIPVADLGFQYGFGFFETIRVDNGKPKHLEAHLDRFYHTWRHLFAENPPDLTWDEIIDQVIAANRLGDKTAALKITATRGDRETLPFNHTLLVTARPYTHRLAGTEEQGINLAVYPHPRQSPLADHKTLNYLYYFLAGKWAAARGAAEALILNPDGTVSETHTANILLIKDRTVVLPVSPHVLPGIMEKAACNYLSNNGCRIEKKSLKTADLLSFDQIYLTNSLMGVVPVLSIDKKKLSKPSDLWQKINQEIL
ncbi:MAG: aminodeoxychorismate synthase component I, partial [Deltaproteobacteria bacterium]|nr:aminodeoxychorismate synthase component I [Deltaproteobacteria bacterium]